MTPRRMFALRMAARQEWNVRYGYAGKTDKYPGAAMAAYSRAIRKRVGR